MMVGRRKRYQLGKARTLYIGQEEMDGAQIKDETNGNQNGQVQRGTGRGIKVFFFLGLLALGVFTFRTWYRIRPQYRR
jgi:hypothetical protein